MGKYNFWTDTPKYKYKYYYNPEDFLYHYPILDARISSVLLLLLRHTQGTPPGFCNGMDWRALLELRPPNIGQLRG